MAGSNDFLTFATGGGANVLSQAAYAALTSLLANGYQAGVAQSSQLNKTWRQAAIMAAVLAQYVADSGPNVVDDGTTATILTNLKNAVRISNKATTVTAASVALTAADCGVILVNATSNNVTITLPAVNAITSASLKYEFVRVDATANTVTINRAGSDTFVGGATSITLSGQKDNRSISGNGAALWATTTAGGNQSLATSGYREIGGGLLMQWGFADASATSTGTTAFPITFPITLYQVLIGASTGNASTSQLTGSSLSNFSWDRNSINSSALPYVAFGK